MNNILRRNLIEWRRELKLIPELAYNEFKTQEYIIRILKGIGLNPIKKALTGVIVDIEFTPYGPFIAFRADMDALPFESEDGGVTPKVVHACGHDVHIAILLGFAYKLKEYAIKEHKIVGTVRLIFQPAEELLTTKSGAFQMIKEEVLNVPDLKSIYALHVSPRYEVGQVAYCSGHFMAECFRIKLEIKSKAGHASFSNKFINPILIISEIIIGMQKVINEEANLSICKINGGLSINTIPQTVIAEGTLRAKNKKKVISFIEKLEHYLNNIIDEYDQVNINFIWEKAYSALINSPALEAKVIDALSDIVGRYNVKNSGNLLAAEDFSAYTELIPGAMFLLGVRDKNTEKFSPVHSIDFIANNDSMIIGVKCLESIFLRELR